MDGHQEGFLCPICMTDLGDVIQLQVHFEENHSKEDPAVIRNLKDFFGKAKEKIKKGKKILVNVPFFAILTYCCILLEESADLDEYVCVM